MPYQFHTPPPAPPLPAVPVSSLPQHFPPTRASKALQYAAFTIATGLTFYAVLVYDFGNKEHCFQPVRRWFDDKTSSLFVLSEEDRRVLNENRRIKLEKREQVRPSGMTPVEFFKEEGVKGIPFGREGKGSESGRDGERN